MHASAESLPRSGKFIAPGTLPAPERLAQVRRALVDDLAAIATDHRLVLERSADPDERLLRSEGLSLPWLCEFVEAGLKRLIRSMSADLIGGPCVTRLDRSLTIGHPRLPYRRVLRIVGGRGWRLALGDEPPADALASLVRFCGLLPVQVLYLPGQPAPASLPSGHQGLSYVLPWGGEALRGELPLDGGAGPATCRIRVDRLLQFVLGLEDNGELRAC
jgi:hypothetical protein